MKNLLFICSILFFVSGWQGSVTAQPQYYNYTGSGNGSNSFPFNVSAGKDVQLLYLAGDFNQPSPAPAGNIISVSVFMNAALGPATYTDLTIKLAQSNITNLTAGAFYSGPMTTVYYRASVVLTNPASSWMTFVLDSPFAYDPAQSLIVDIGQCGATGTLGGTCAYTNLTGVRRVWSVGGCPFAPYASSSIYVYNMGFNLATSGPPIVTTNAATAVTTASATLNGTVNANGDLTTVSFEYGLTTAYGTTVPGVPATVSGTTDTPVSANIAGLLPGTTYHFRAKGSNSNGSVNGLDMTFATFPVPPLVVTTSASGIGSTVATLNGTVVAGGASTTVTFEYGLTNAYGTTVPGVPGTVTGNSLTPVSANITGLSLTTTYHYRVVGVNSEGPAYGFDSTFTTTNCPMPGNPGAISGPASPCGNSLGNVYSVAPIVNAQSYVWTVPTGAVITYGGSTNSITVTFGNTSGNITVYGVDTCGNGPVGTLPVTIVPAPEPTISGPDSMCVNSGYYNYSTEPGMTNYIWSISAGGTITYGQGTNQAQVTWNSSGAQWVNVNYTGPSGCQAGTPTVFPVAVTGVPGDAGPITGTAAACGGASGVAYSVAPIANTIAYVWTLPAGAAIASGEWTNAITVNFAPDASSGSITVYGNNLCGNGSTSPSFAVTVTPLPADAGAITGQASVCTGDMGVSYSVPPIANATGYLWTVPAGATIASGTNTSSILVDFGTVPDTGTITVAGTNSCGNGMVSPDLPVTINEVPPAPVITMAGSTLMSDAPAGNQWYLDGTAIPGATGTTHVPSQSGIYTCMVTLNGCSSEFSNEIPVIMTGLAGTSTGNVVSIFPNPGHGVFTIQFITSRKETFSIQVFNALGVMIREVKEAGGTGKFEQVIDLRPTPNGIYTVVIHGSQGRMVEKVLVNN
jgi:hypothetical protein